MRAISKGDRRKSSSRPEPGWLTVPAVASRVPAPWKWHYDRLLRMLEELGRVQREHLGGAADMKPALNTSTLETASAEFERDMLLGEAACEQDTIYEIEQALKRIQQGGYGICELTGKAISKARLRAIPWTRFSKSAQADIEAGSAPGTRRIGELRPVRISGRASATAKRNGY